MAQRFGYRRRRRLLPTEAPMGMGGVFDRRHSMRPCPEANLHVVVSALRPGAVIDWPGAAAERLASR